MAKKESTDQPAVVRVRITANRTLAAGLIHAAGTVVNLPLDKAQALEQLGKGVILGV